ncbi:MAG: hypothetical protein HFJ58_05955 [Clostridia bacterium]|nr:hypothetical protein [Clostridia bacterium]
MKEQNISSVQEWLPIIKILERGIIKLKDNSYIKIIKIIPINYNLKSELEKKAILNSYKIFLKTCNFDIQILIQSNKEDLSKHISNIKKQVENEKNENIINLSKNYIEFIQKTNKERKSSSKNFYIIIKNPGKNKKENNIDGEIIIQDLNEKYFKVKECLSRCGNIAQEYYTKEETMKVLLSFFNSRNYISTN